MPIDPNVLKDPNLIRLQEQKKQQREFFGGFGETVADVALGVPRGILDAAEGVYDLVDTVAFDILPDANFSDVLGEAKTGAGALVGLPVDAREPPGLQKIWLFHRDDVADIKNI